MGTSSVNFSEFSVHRSVFAKCVNGITEQNTAKVWTLKTELQTISYGAHARVGRISFHLTPEMGPIGCPENVGKKLSLLAANSQEECSSPLPRGGSLKSTLRPKFPFTCFHAVTLLTNKALRIMGYYYDFCQKARVVGQRVNTCAMWASYMARTSGHQLYTEGEKAVKHEH